MTVVLLCEACERNYPELPEHGRLPQAFRQHLLSGRPRELPK